MACVFINYRRSEATGDAGRIAARLRQCFAARQVFLDVDGGIGNGEDFPTAIENALARASALVVVIGREWLNCVTPTGKRRLDDSSDWVRREIAISLKRGIQVLPVLVDRAAMPSADQLPEDLKPLASRNFIELRASTWRYDSGRIVSALRRSVPLNCVSVFLAILILACLAISIWQYFYWYPPTSFVLEKVQGDGVEIRGLEWNNKNPFKVRVLDLQRRPIYGAKIAWHTDFCPNFVYVGSSDENGIASATNVCSATRPFGVYKQTATPVTADTPVGIACHCTRLRTTGLSVQFDFKSP